MINYEKRLKVVTMLVIILYILFFVWALYFKFGNIDEVRRVSFYIGKMSLKERFLFDIIPFDFRNTHQKWLHFLLNILNFIVFMPLGVALCIKDKAVKWKKHILICFVISLVFEIIQLFTAIGGFASDDLLMNTLGYFGGALVYKIIFSKFNDKINYYIIIACNIIITSVLVFAIITLIPKLGEDIEIINKYAFK
jgi:glycopeptide antibiotics resistance protein